MTEIGFVWNYSGFWQDSLRRHLCAHAILAPRRLPLGSGYIWCAILAGDFGVSGCRAWTGCQIDPGFPFFTGFLVLIDQQLADFLQPRHHDCGLV